MIASGVGEGTVECQGQRGIIFEELRNIFSVGTNRFLVRKTDIESLFFPFSDSLYLVDFQASSTVDREPPDCVFRNGLNC